MKFRISDDELNQRGRRIGYGALFSAALAGLVAVQHNHYPSSYNDALVWSVVGFVALANLVNYLRHRRYINRARDHRVEILDKQLRFTTGEEISELDLNDVATMRNFNRHGQIGHIQLKLRNGRGIRLEGYENMEVLAEELKRRLPERQVNP